MFLFSLLVHIPMLINSRLYIINVIKTAWLKSIVLSVIAGYVVTGDFLR
ncbi:MAG: hypothetical protein GTO60_02220 [Gammaproteobacteria bacterium]|nr:hypothetical protein [Gammaproteobacteria bacterium]